MPSMITMTVSGDRPGYLDETLDSWSRVRGLRDRSFGFAVRPRQSPRDRYLRDAWFEAARAPHDGAGSGFDFGIERIADATGLRFVAPLASRSDNIGREGGVHALPEDFEASRAPTFLPHRAPVARRARRGAAGPVELPATVEG